MKFKELDKSVQWAFYSMGAVFLVLFIATGITIYIAVKDHEPILDADYYEKGLNYDKTLEDVRVMKEQGYNLEGELFTERFPLTQGENPIRIRFVKQGNPITNAVIHALRERGATVKFNKTYQFQNEGNGYYTANVDIPDYGMWVLTFYATHEDRTLTKSLRVIVQR